MQFFKQLIMKISYLAIGSNSQNARENIEKAISLIAENFTLIKTSFLFKTPALLKDDDAQDNKIFLNTAVEIKTTLNPFDLLDKIQEIEKQLGKNNKTWKARVIDIDILTYDDLEINSERLKIPHTGLFQRSFVLDPLLHITNGEFFKKVLKASRKLKTKQPVIVGVININDNSFSNDGTLDEKILREKIRHWNENGVQMIDIGSQSTRPDSTLIAENKERELIIWGLKIILDELSKSNFKYTLPRISIDSFYKNTIQEAKLINPEIITNDQSGLIRCSDSTIISMHNNALPVDKSKMFKDLKEMKLSLFKFLNAIPKQENYIIDPGIGFGKIGHHSLYIIQNIPKLFFRYNLKIMIGHSRKRFLSEFNNSLNPQDRDIETLGISIGILNKVEFIRVHNPILHIKAIVSFLHTNNQLKFVHCN